MKMGWIRRQSPEKIHPKNQSALERSAAEADAATVAFFAEGYEKLRARR